MNRILRLMVYPEALLKAKFLRFSGSVSNIRRKVKIVADEDEDFIKISFRYGSSTQTNVNLVANKQEELQSVLARIKLMVSIFRQKEDLRRAVLSRYSSNAASAENISNSNEQIEDVDVSMIQNDQRLKSNITNVEAWTHGALLKIGQFLYEVDQNCPTVVTLSLPNTILAECPIRPHVIVECADIFDSNFTWYHSVSEKEVVNIDGTVAEGAVKIDDNWWLNIYEGFIYWTNKNDIGRKLSVVCTPKQGERSGRKFAVQSEDVVEAGPDSFPFEERHLYTKELTSADSLRCLSYNILANVYVETKKFPYCSRVAKDVYYRKQLLIKELLGYNSDILCLQEVQGRIFEFDLLPDLRKRGYDGFYMKKGGRRHEGLACFFRSSKFNVIRSEGVLLNEIIKDKKIFIDLLTKVSGNYKDMSKLLAQDTALQIVLLEDRNDPKRRVLVANTHLYSNKNMPEVRLIQSALCIYYLEHVLKMQDPDSSALLFCGDFNSLPDSAVVEFLLKGTFQCCSSWKNANVGSLSDTTLRHNLPLDSACGFPIYTNYTEMFNGCLDYIFYNNNNFSVNEIVPLPSHESVTQYVGLPSELFPSDHIPIICTLQWK